MRDNARVTQSTFIDRIDERLTALGMTDHTASLLASENRNRDMIRDLRRRGQQPKRETMNRLAEALETTVEYLKTGRNTGTVLADRRSGYDAGGPPDPFASQPRTLQVYGTALGAEMQFEDANLIEAHLIEMVDVIDWVRRPPLLEGRKDVYALYVSGSSMEPRYEPGDPVVVDPKRAPKPGDDVIVQIRDGEGDGTIIRAALIKRLVRRTAVFVELRQYNPATTFRVPVDRVASMHRVLGMRDIVS